jgi:O-antigen ligase
MTAMESKRAFSMDNVFPLIMEYGIYLFAVLMFAGRFGTFREIGLYLPAFLWLLQGILKKKIDLQWREPLFIALIGFLLSAVVSSLLSPLPLQSLLMLKKEYLKVLLLYIAISATFVSPESLKRFALLLAFTGIVYLAAGFHKVFADFSTLGSINYDETRDYASTFLYFFPFFVLQALGTSGLKRGFWMIPTIGSIAGIFIIGVRGSWLAMAGIAGLWTYALRGRTRDLSVPLKAGVPAVLAIILLVFVLFPGQYALIRGHTLEKVQMSLRTETWKNFLTMSGERLIAGHGLNDAAMSRDYREFYKRLRGTYPSEGFNPTTPHNQFIKILYQQGFPGLFLYAVLLGILFTRVIKEFLRSRQSWYAFVGIAVIAPVLGEYVIRCLTEDRSLVPLGLLLGMSGAYLHLRKVNKGGADG